MNKIEKLTFLITYDKIKSLPVVDYGYEFKTGWYIFVSPISGILKMKIIRAPIVLTSSSGLLRFLSFKILSFVEANSPTNISEMISSANKSLLELSMLQKQLFKIVGNNKIVIHNPGIYQLELIADTVNYVNQQSYNYENAYLLFNGIDAGVLDYYINDQEKDIRNLDFYLNDPFYKFNYDMDGFKIYKKHLNYEVSDLELTIGNFYNCKIDYINRNSSYPHQQLAIIKIYRI